jgi:SAM-dependent methyltransferase
MIQQLIPEPPKPESIALDLACSGGIFSNLLQTRGFKVVGLDLNEDDLECAHCNDVMTILASVEQIPLRSEVFSLVVALEIIEHLAYGRILLQESNRVIRKDGDLLTSTPNRLSLEGMRGRIAQLLTGVEYTFWDNSHQYIYRSFEFAQLVKGFFTLQEVWGYMPFFAIDKSMEKILQKTPFYRFFSKPVKSIFKWFCFDIIIKCTKKGKEDSS